MNKRIRELIVQSGNGQFHNGKCYPHIGSRTLEDWTKFAELIVRECADTAENCFVYWPMDGSLQRKGCANAIKKHFGVE